MKKHLPFVELCRRLRESKLADRAAQFLQLVQSISWSTLRLKILFAYAPMAVTITQTLSSTTAGYKNKDLTYRKRIWNQCKISYLSCLILGEQRQQRI